MSQSRFYYKSVDTSLIRVGVVGASYNPELADALVKTTCGALALNGLIAGNIEVVRVPGSFEVPVVASEMAHSGEFHVVIALGVVVAGDTSHHEQIGHTTAQALLDISIASRTPVVNGILVVNNQEQAHERVNGNQARGREFAEAALHMATLKRNWTES
ncbi:MAG: 6,7-dimethyl-8-ribityllumazine synthase [Opitutales bacterium]|jgi:6,7-dimethyl-8-ribityllumazine synthase|nr:6,7-dimethyl-8-ribityllumazine synthase [Opitutales bacterium]